MTRACTAVGLARATAYRYLEPPPRRVSRPRRPNHRRLSPAERARVLEVLDSERFIDQPPREVYATLLEEGRFLCSIRTMYRLLGERGALRERRDHQERVQHAVPRLVATAPNQVWTWDISKLATFTSGVFLNLYVILDLFSRYVVAWMIAERENSALAKQLFAEAISRYGIEPGTLLVHQDRGAPMTAHGFAELLSLLGVDRSYSRPRVSNDNPHQESLFHTVKYQPDYPGRFRDRVELNPIDPGQEPIPADRILAARDAELASLWTTAPRPSTVPVIHLPGAHFAGPGAELPQPFPS